MAQDVPAALGVPVRGLRAIAAFEAAKGVLAALAAAGLLLLGPEALRAHVAALLRAIGIDRDGHGVAAGWLAKITPDTLMVAVALIAAYAAMRLLEGWGLWRGREWASWLGCIGAAVYLPFEIVAVWRHSDWLTWGLLLVNAAVVLVLARDLHRRHRGPTP